MFRSWGLTLLHNHFKLEQGELPIQDIGVKKSEKTYITTPRFSSYEKEFFPAVLHVQSANNLIPLEFSTDCSALIANEELMKNPEFVTDLYHSLVENDLIANFGLIYGKIVNSSYGLVELNYEGRISRLTEVKNNDISNMKNLIQTSWFFSPKINGTNCVPNNCLSYCEKDSQGNHQNGHSQPYHDPGVKITN